MNRDQLEAFFAKADDVLTDWQGSADSMSTSPPPPGYLDLLGTIGIEPTPWQQSVLGSLFDDDHWDRYLQYRDLVYAPLLVTYPRPLIVTGV